MQPINKIMKYYWDKKPPKRLQVLEVDIIIIQKNINLMSLAQRIHFLQDMFQMTTIALVSVINPNPINGLHLFWDTLYVIIILDIISNKMVINNSWKSKVCVKVVLFPVWHLILPHMSISKPNWKSWNAKKEISVSK